MEATTQEERGWFGYEDAGRYCGLGRTKLTELVTTGEVLAAKVGTRVLIQRKSLDEFLARNSYAEAAQR